ncbi:hypothetical protein BJ912DRAFT_523565 [Pholiota molesta]|nr:hypothetical protein BJ912DRAFT_523565 [Pholiota molesta]
MAPVRADPQDVHVLIRPRHRLPQHQPQSECHPPTNQVLQVRRGRASSTFPRAARIKRSQRIGPPAMLWIFLGCCMNAACACLSCFRSVLACAVLFCGDCTVSFWCSVYLASAGS